MRVDTAFNAFNKTPVSNLISYLLNRCRGDSSHITPSQRINGYGNDVSTIIFTVFFYNIMYTVIHIKSFESKTSSNQHSNDFLSLIHVAEREKKCTDRMASNVHVE